MICPNCKCEYIRGVTECADCGVALVDKLEPEEETLPRTFESFRFGRVTILRI
jgi:transcription initiation factor TFIIIB Brf1 subunit/transcription initiation factor TFIIB